MGTGPYMSPEQVQFVRNDPRSDLFALGVMLYHFTTGAAALRRARHRARPAPPPVHRPGAAARAAPDCPPWLQEIILRCLEVQPDKRWQTGAQLALALRHPDQVTLTDAPSASNHKAAGAPARWAAARQRRAGRTAGAGRVSQAMKSPDRLAASTSTCRGRACWSSCARPCAASCHRARRAPGLRERDAHRPHRRGRPRRRRRPSRHVKQLVALKHWARRWLKALKLDEGRLTFHVLEAPDPAAAIVDFAERNQVDHIVMGARGNSALRRYLGSVSSQVVAQAAAR
jgi:eukaryotic-like serine/threonine-protein kinase